MPPLITLQRGNKKKVVRHVEAAQFVLDAKVYFRRNAVGRDELFKQLSEIGVSEHDDYIDAFSDAFHPLCYNNMHRIGPVAVQPDDPVTFPWDHYLKGNYQDKLQSDLDRIIYG
jgi:hypothetical protein